VSGGDPAGRGDPTRDSCRDVTKLRAAIHSGFIFQTPR
jgi:hypothetical protein